MLAFLSFKCSIYTYISVNLKATIKNKGLHYYRYYILLTFNIDILTSLPSEKEYSVL
jgi:hypothetical protein